MDNILAWGSTDPIDVKWWNIWREGEPYGMHWLASQYKQAADSQNLLDYKIIITVHSNHNISENISSFSEKTIIVLHTDHLHYRTGEFSVSGTILNFILAAEANPEKTILFCCGSGHLDRDLSLVTIPKNLIIQYWSTGTFWHLPLTHKNCPKVIDKTIKSKGIICLNNRNRPHRTALVAYLLSKGLDQYCHLSYLELTTHPYVDCFLAQCSVAAHQPISEIVSAGVDKFNNHKQLLLQNSYFGSTVKNYNILLKSLYSHSFVEIIPDTTFFESSTYNNDKYLNSVLGANFPILIAGAGSVQLLRELGFDMFDDIVNHSYDLELDPIIRLASAIEDNLQLITSDQKILAELWQKNKDRFLKNQNFFTNEMPMITGDIIKEMSVQAIAQCLSRRSSS